MLVSIGELKVDCRPSTAPVDNSVDQLLLMEIHCPQHFSLRFFRRSLNHHHLSSIILIYGSTETSTVNFKLSTLSTLSSLMSRLNGKSWRCYLTVALLAAEFAASIAVQMNERWSLVARLSNSCLSNSWRNENEQNVV